MASLIKSLIGRFYNKKEWRNIEYFDESWKQRIFIMSKYIPNNSKTIMDLGCGRMWLKEHLNSDQEYIGVDYKERSKDTIVCDFNKLHFPEKTCDTVFISGCLEYIDNVDWFIMKVAKAAPLCVISYCNLDIFSNKKQRLSFAWKNHLLEVELIDKFLRNNMFLKATNVTQTKNKIYVFSSEKV